MKFPINIRDTLLVLGIAAAIAFIISALSDLPFWAAAIIVFGFLFYYRLKLAEYGDNFTGWFKSGEEITIENKKRNKKLLPYRIALWVVLALILIWLLCRKGEGSGLFF